MSTNKKENTGGKTLAFAGGLLAGGLLGYLGRGAPSPTTYRVTEYTDFFWSDRLEQSIRFPKIIKKEENGGELHYEIKHVIGQGGFGFVIEYHSTVTGAYHPIVVKLLMGRSQQREDLIKDYLRNMGISNETCGMLDVHYLLDFEGGLGFVLEKFDGDMDSFAVRNSNIFPAHYSLDIDVMNDMEKQLSKQLACLEKAGLFYTDMKPSNILWKNENGKFVFKFGDLGSLMSPGDLANIGKNQTSTYIPPFLISKAAEAFRAGRQMTAKSDLRTWSYYLFGITLVAIRVSTNREDMLRILRKYGTYEYTINGLEIIDKTNIGNLRASLKDLVDDKFPCVGATKALNKKIKQYLFLDEELGLPPFCGDTPANQRRKRTRRKRKSRKSRKNKNK
tara:strand:+ start:3375 stop:4547 length:1173 start_codon:yes stop_codon:yes gene_type:complete